MRFSDRREAGRRLAKELTRYKGKDAVVYALPRGGVVIGFEVAKALKAPLDLVITRKIGHPQNPEYAVCAVTEEGEFICDEKEAAALDRDWLEKEREKEMGEARRRKELYLGGKERVSAKGKTAVVVDDGVATGLTVLAAVRSLRRQNPKEIIVAVPVVSRDIADNLRKAADKVVVLEEVESLDAVGNYYKDFSQVSDEEVVEFLNSLAKPPKRDYKHR